MERSIRMFVIAGLLALGASVAVCQPISINASDVQEMYAVGRTIIYHHDTLTSMVELGSSGVPMIWDFSGLNSNKLEVLKSVAVAPSPYASEFPQATHALLDTAFAYRVNTGTIGFGWGTITSSAAYSYYGLDVELKFYGMGAEAVGNLDDLPGVPIPIANPRWLNVPPSVDFSFPLEFSKTWVNNYSDSLLGSINFLGPHDVRIGNTDSITYEVDAYGTLLMPGGHTQQALRIRKLGRYSFVDTVNNINIPLQYIFLAKNCASVHVSMADPTVTTGRAQVRSVKWTDPLPTDVTTTDGIPAKFGLAQNYPNPFNPTTVVSYQLSAASSVKLAVYDMLGREIALLVDEQKPAGEYRVLFDATGLSSGTYHYRLTATDGKQMTVETKSMLLLR